MTKLEGGLNTTETLAAHADNMEWLQLDYVDHLMTHFPADWYVMVKKNRIAVDASLQQAALPSPCRPLRRRSATAATNNPNQPPPPPPPGT